MFGFDKIDFQRFTVAVVGALMLTTISVGAAVIPAEFGTSMPVPATAPSLLVSHA